MRLGVALTPALGVGECVPVLEPGARPEELALPLAEPLDDPLAALPEAAPLALPLDELDELVDVGGVWVAGGVDEVEDGEQPAKAAEARMAKTPRRTAVSFVPSTEPAITRTVM